MNVAKQRAITDAAMDYSLSSGDTDCLEFVHSLALAKKIVTRMVSHEWSIKKILDCANHEDWASCLFQTIRELIPVHSARWYEFIDAISSLEMQESSNLSYNDIKEMLNDPLARAFLIKKYGEGERAGYADESVWCLIIRERIAKGDFTRAFDEIKKLIRYPSFRGRESQHRVSRTTFDDLVGELYSAMVARGLVPPSVPDYAVNKSEWSERKRWKSTAPDVFVFLGYYDPCLGAGITLSKWYLMRRWRADKKRVRH